MTPAARRALIIGGGYSGMSAAIALRRRGVEVDLVEIAMNWRSYEAGIGLIPAALRAFGQLGILDRFRMHGYAADGVDLCMPHGPKVAALSTPRLAGADVPGSGAIMMPVLTRILADATRASGATTRMGCTFTAIKQDAEGVEVSFTDGTKSRYDLVVGADGLHSEVRAALFPDAPRPRYAGQSVWRAVVPKAPEIETATIWMGPRIKPGVSPVSKSEMYVFVTEPTPWPRSSGGDPAELLAQMRTLLAEFRAPTLQAVREQLGVDSHIIFRPVQRLLMGRPWSRGRVVLIGEAVHATTPHLAAGTCVSMEDALVLADELASHPDVPAALSAFERRRWDRCRMVAESSARLGEIEIAGGDKDEYARLMRLSLISLAQPV